MKSKKLEKLIKSALKEAILDSLDEKGLLSEESKKKIKERITKQSKKSKKADKAKLIADKFSYLQNLIDKKLEKDTLKEFYQGISSHKFTSPDDAIQFLLKSEKWKKNKDMGNVIKEELQVRLSDTDKKVKRYEMILYPIEEEKNEKKEQSNKEETKKGIQKGVSGD